VLRIREWFPRAPLAVLGFSLGGNFALRIGLRGPAAGLELAGVVGVCPVLDPGETMAALDDGWFGYRFHFMRNWRRHLEDKRRAFPERYDFSETRSLDSITAMTHWFVARHTPYESTERYLGEYTLTGDFLAPLAVPARILTSLDDPVIPAAGLDRLHPAPLLDVAVTRWGGHCGFVADARLGNWSDAPLRQELDRLTGGA
jgi:predicted alpha/beta-fold hydrolase